MTMRLFFLLSGFGMDTQYQADVEVSRPWWRYLWRRLARVYPTGLTHFAYFRQENAGLC